MKLEEIRAAESRLLLQHMNATRCSLFAARACICAMRRATEYLDLLSGIGVNALGYSHPAIEERDCKTEPRADPYVEPVLSTRDRRSWRCG
jgi:acetylornithine/succinyldiaminopimelate/putrescine aminotransferase